MKESIRSVDIKMPDNYELIGALLIAIDKDTHIIMTTLRIHNPDIESIILEAIHQHMTQYK